MTKRVLVWFCGLAAVMILYLSLADNADGGTSFSQIPSATNQEDSFVLTEVYSSHFTSSYDLNCLFDETNDPNHLGIKIIDTTWLECRNYLGTPPTYNHDYIKTKDIYLEHDPSYPLDPVFIIQIEFKLPNDVWESDFPDNFYLIRNDIISVYLKSIIINEEYKIYLFGKGQSENRQLCEVTKYSSHTLEIFSYEDNYDIYYDDNLKTNPSLTHYSSSWVNSFFVMGNYDLGTTGAVKWNYLNILGRPDLVFFENFNDGSLCRWPISDYTGDSEVTARTDELFISTYGAGSNNWKALLQTRYIDFYFELDYYCDFYLDTQGSTQMQQFWLVYSNYVKMFIDNGDLKVRARDVEDEDLDGDHNDPIDKKVADLDVLQWYYLHVNLDSGVLTVYLNNIEMGEWWSYQVGGSCYYMEIGDFGTTSIIKGIHIDDIWIRNQITTDKDSDGLSDLIEDYSEIFVFHEDGEYSWNMKENGWTTSPYIPDPNHPDLYSTCEVWEKSPILGNVAGEPAYGHGKGITDNSKGYVFGTAIADDNNVHGYLPDTEQFTVQAHVLTSPAIDLTNIKTEYCLFFKIFTYINMEPETGSVCMEYSRNNGLTWSSILFNSYNQDWIGMILPGWGGGDPSKKDWTYQSEGSKPYCGRTYSIFPGDILRVRFIITWAGNTNEDRTGFYFDDLTITIYPCTASQSNSNTDGDGILLGSLKDGEEFYLGTSMFLIDTDGDALGDVDEVNNIVINDPSLNNGGSDPILRDIFIEIGWFSSTTCGHGNNAHQPPANMFNGMMGIFSERGIHIHPQTGASFSGNQYILMDINEAHYLYDNQFTANRRSFYRYCIVGCKADQIAFGADPYGVTEVVQVPGSLYIVFDGKIREKVGALRTRDVMWKSTFLHELGHSLGLGEYSNQWGYSEHVPTPLNGIMVIEMLEDSQWVFVPGYTIDGDEEIYAMDDHDPPNIYEGYVGGWCFSQHLNGQWDYGLSINGVSRGKTWT